MCEALLHADIDCRPVAMITIRRKYSSELLISTSFMIKHIVIDSGLYGPSDLFNESN